jgi:type IV secretion system protein VirD4
LGGLSGDELGEFSRLCGQYRETLTTTQRGSHGTTMQTNLTDRPVISADEIRTLSAERREALIVQATTPPVLTRMIRHYESRDARHYAGAVTQAQALLAAANGHILAGAPRASGEEAA